jgi:hypothetical protein
MLPETKYCNITDIDEVLLQASARNWPNLNDPRNLKAVYISLSKRFSYKFA